MQQSFWETRWREGRIGFHRDEPNPYLVRHALAMKGWPGRVFLPLAGKSVDVPWLRDRGCEVVANEWVKEAVEAFFEEQNLDAVRQPSGDHQLYEAENLRFFQGDFFSLTRDQVGEVDWAFDRAALIALPTEARSRYVEQLVRLVGADHELLLVHVEYDPEGMEGPPFSVSVDEVRTLFRGAHLTLLEEQSALDDNSRFRAAGLTWLTERAWRIQL
ncbi:MAG: thiopurine S-methyltransferase [Myxococcota bacterium]